MPIVRWRLNNRASLKHGRCRGCSASTESEPRDRFVRRLGVNLSLEPQQLSVGHFRESNHSRDLPCRSYAPKRLAYSSESAYVGRDVAPPPLSHSLPRDYNASPDERGASLGPEQRAAQQTVLLDRGVTASGSRRVISAATAFRQRDEAASDPNGL